MKKHGGVTHKIDVVNEAYEIKKEAFRLAPQIGEPKPNRSVFSIEKTKKNSVRVRVGREEGQIKEREDNQKMLDPAQEQR